MSDEKPENKKRKWPIRWYRAIMDWQVWKDWSGWVKVIVVIWVLLPFPNMYEILQTWLPWIHSLLDEIGTLLSALSESTSSESASSESASSQEGQNQSLFDQVRASMLVIAAWYGVPFLIWRMLLADRQTQATEMQTQAADKQTEINRESHYTDLFTKAIEQLGATSQNGGPAIETRIGAIYSLERLAKDSERDYGPIIETLAAYIREHCRDPKSFDDKKLSGDELKLVQQKWEEVLSALKEEDFNGIKFDQARYEWIMSLLCNSPADRADVAAALTVLSRREQNRHWTSTSENETQPDFTGANFQGATLWNKSEGLAREGTNLRLARLEGAGLWEANLEDAELMGAKLSGANLIAAKFKGADLSEAKLVGANLINSKIVKVNLIGADLKGANLTRADIKEDTMLKVAKLESAKFCGAVFCNVNLEGANFRDANLGGAVFNETNLSGALLAGVDLRDSNGLTTEMLQEAFGDENTSLPNGVTPPEHWGSEQEAIEKWQAFCEGEGFPVTL
ncbi:MAG: pentapeptide repeat-containing protein [Gemmatimonadetes bacterium]|nr:pentapeptide repeat-containing protein [Gemmatimonadota bacterium]